MQFMRRIYSRAEAQRWAAAAACVVGAILVRVLFGGWIDDRAALLVFAPAAMLAAWFGGFAPGATVAVVGALIGDALYLSPLGIRSGNEAAVIATFLATSFIGVVACTAVRELRGRLGASLHELVAQRRTLQHELDQRRRSENVLRDRELRLRLLTDAVPGLASYMDRDLVYRVVNRAYTEWFGRGADEIVGRPAREVLGDDAFARAEPYLRRALAGEAVDYEAELPYKDGGARFVRAHYVPHVDEAGAVQGVYVIVQDLTARRRAEAALAGGEQRFAAFMENLPGAAWMKDLAGRYVCANAEAVRAFGMSLEQFIGHRDDQIFAPETARAFVENDRRVLETGGSLTTVESLPQPDGIEHHSLVSKFVVPGPDGRAAYVGGVAVDVTSRLAAERALRDSEQRFRGFAHNSDDVLWITDAQGCRLVYISPSFRRLFGRDIGELYAAADGFLRFVHEDDRARVADERTRCAAGPHTLEYRAVRPDGSVVWVRDRGFPVYDDDDGTLRYLAGIAEDVTVQKQAEQALHESERRYRFLAESIPQIVFTARPDGVVNYHNEQLLHYLGATREELSRLGWIHFRHPDDREEASRQWSRAVATGEPYECTYRMRRGGDGAWRWHLARATPMRDESGAVVMWFGTCTDVDDQRRAQDLLGESEQEFRAVFELAGSGKAMVEPSTGRFVRVNRKLCEMTGYAAEELLGMTFSDVTHPDDRAWTARECARMFRGETPVYDAEKRYVAKDGGVIWVHVIATLIRDAAGNPLRAAGVIQDITQRKRAEAALRDSAASLARAQRIAGVGSWELDLRTRAVAWSEQMYRIFGVTRDDYAPSVEGFFGFLPVEEHATIREFIDRAVNAGETYRVEHRIVLRDGTVRHVSEHAELVRDEATGEPVKLVGTALDVTERKRHADELAAANRAKDQFLAMLSHELRTPLTPVVLAVDSLRTDAALPAHVREDLDMIRRNVGLEAKLIDDLLDLTRVARGKLELHRERVDVHAALQHAVRSCYNADGLEKRLTVRVDLAARACHVRADASRLEQVFFNLLRNAVKFTPEGGSVAVRTRDASDQTLSIEITDSGVGIDPDVLPRLFNAFEQGDRAVTRHFGGLGLGLAICKAIVDLHGGSIRAHSDGPNRGATFVVELPTAPAPAASEETPQSKPPMAASTASAGGSLTRHVPPRLLLVEDHQTTAAMMARLFTRLGYDVKSAGDVATALSLAGRHQFDLVISDLGLPDGSGLDLMRHLRDRHGLRGIALSGFGMEEDLAQSKAAGFTEHLVKPISFDKLELSIHRVMRETSGGGGGGGDGADRDNDGDATERAFARS